MIPEVAKTLLGTHLPHVRVCASSWPLHRGLYREFPSLVSCRSAAASRFQFLADKRSWFLKDPDAAAGGWEDRALQLLIAVSMVLIRTVVTGPEACNETASLARQLQKQSRMGGPARGKCGLVAQSWVQSSGTLSRPPAKTDPALSIQNSKSVLIRG